MKWRCNNCGHEQPAHPKTTPDEMPLCSQRVAHRGISKIAASRYYPVYPVNYTFNQREILPHPDIRRQWMNEGECGGRPEKIA